MTRSSGTTEHWPQVKLADVAELCLGKMLDAEKNKGRLLPYLRNPNVRWFDVDTADIRMMPFEEREDDRYGLRAGDVVICEGGEAGRAAVWDGRIPNLKFQKAIHRVRPAEELDARYLVHRLMFDYHRGGLADYYTGVTIKHLTGQDLARYRFPLPPVSEQRRITEILDKADALRAKRRGALAELDTLTQSIFLDMFGDPATNKKGWPEHSLGSLILGGPQNGLYKPGNLYGSGVPILRIDAFYDGEVTTVAGLKRVRISDEEKSRYALLPGDIVINRVNSREFLGKSAVIPQLIETTVFESNMMRFGVDRQRIHPQFLIALLQTRHLRAQIARRAKDAVNQSSINQEDVASFRVIVPPLSVQQVFARAKVSSEELRQREVLSLDQLDALFVSLQHRAFRGEL